MPRKTTDETIADWEELARTVDQEIRDTDPSIANAYNDLAKYLAEINKLIDERSFHEARKQEATRSIQELLVKGLPAATMVRSGLKMRFGRDSEQLVRFGIRPFRGQKPGKKKRKKPNAAR
jgi:phage shock protein A